MLGTLRPILRIVNKQTSDTSTVSVQLLIQLKHQLVHISICYHLYDVSNILQIT